MRITVVLLPAIIIGSMFSACHSKKKVNYSTEVKPILNKHCISCHGGVKQSGGFSVLFKEEALGNTKSGKPAIIPGHPEKSEFIRRLTCKDPKERMPQKGAKLSEQEIELLTQWVKEGAEWGEHWAYIPPTDIQVPDISIKDGNNIDKFIQQKLKEEKLSSAAEADKMTLLRRVCFDITGLPPTTELAASFAASKDPAAYEKLVDSLLQSPHFGEHWASMWLDLARYSDTKGYERDMPRNVWRYRDWVIDAFNTNMQYDSFVIKQLAGDLLPAPTTADFIATAFHRNTMSNDEGGTQDEEFRTAAIIDRVNTTMEVFQGMTIGCVQCHSHPYDPIRFEDYYKLMAFLNNTRDEDTYMEHPTYRFYDSLGNEEVRKIGDWVSKYGTVTQQQEVKEFVQVLEPKVHAHTFDQYINGALLDTKYTGVRPNGSCRLPHQNLDGKSNLWMNYTTGNKGGTMIVKLDSLNGTTLVTHSIVPTNGWQAIEIPIPATRGTHDLYFIFKNSGIPADWSVCVIEWLAFRENLPGKGIAGYEEMNKTLVNLVNKSPDNIPVMIENPIGIQRITKVFERGNWLVKGKTVTPDVPHTLNPFPAKAPRNRLGLAEWLVDTANPLSARVMVNRCWEQVFGIGIIETLEDFGTQGFAPSHPELLDYLSYKFMHSYKWQLKPLLKEIVMSATYRQDSKTTPILLEKDPANRLLARGPHFRLTAEEIRDQALVISGVFNPSLHGPSVMPYQPDNIWQTVYNGASWSTATNGNQYRRALYTYHKRTSPYPSMITFDGSSREVCLQRRIRTNTPLQALTTLNDPVYMDAAIALAKRMQEKAKGNVATAIKIGYELALFQPLQPQKLAILQKLYATALSTYQSDANALKKLLKVQDTTPDSANLAALAIVANAIMNLDEFLIKS
ncbi:DUF1553 domain-containing protein [Chitinophaga silvatica]|uniref:DUF1553 domain-containing protein n=2 Tax=Chitinophaga silvatica TaxID=2282649 RepID=A0A3E1Y949_9BACT|nr:DUF1553 domain-containing protein [Chitinophaga silvatica]